MTTRPSTCLIALAVALVLASAPAIADGHEKSHQKNIVETAVAAGSFDTLVAAVTAAGLGDALSADGPLTVFAPTDEAFAKLPAGTVESLLEPENLAKLQAILKYHVVAGELTAADVTSSDSATTLQGDAVAFSTGDGGVMVGDAKVVKADVAASNGVIHVIDTVLLPASGE